MRIYVFTLILIGLLPGVLSAQKSAPQDSLPQYLSLALRESGENVVLMGFNSNYGPLTAYVRERADDSLVMEKVIAPRDSLELLEIPGEREEVKDSLLKRYRFGFHLGDVFSVSPDTTYLYRLPVRKKKKYWLSQGFFGKSSHNKPLSLYAIDIVMQIGEPIYAARDGLVITVIDWFTRSGGPELRDYGNRIVVLHPDGTMASYVHLDHRGVLVREGEAVKRGQLIGYSGNTGFTNGPHLHFVVRKPRDISIPVRFEGYENDTMTSGKKIRVRR